MTSALPEDKRRELDDYPTPDWAIDAVLDYLPLDRGVLEPACGSGAIMKRIRERGVSAEKINGMEIDPKRAQEARDAGFFVLECNSLEAISPYLWGGFGLIISNPPFRHAEAFCRKAIEAAGKGGTVAMLLRLAFLESEKRYAFHQRYPVNGLHVFSSRPSFTENRKTDSAAYAWFCWGPGQPGINVLPPNEKRGSK